MKKIIPLLILLASCGQKEIKTIGTIERLDPALDVIMSTEAKVEIIAEGYDWSEGPVWVEDQDMLLFSDVPKNIIYKWTEEKGAEVYLTPSGFTGTKTTSKEPGSNGLLLDDEGKLVLCQHGDRRLALMNADISSPVADFTTIADNYQGKRFNSPNDAVMGDNHSFYFTDPPYGLGGQMEDPEKDLPFQGVYEVTADGKVRLLVDSLTRPNGIALSLDNKYLYIANSDRRKARWYRYELGDSSVVSGSIFYDAAKNGEEGDAGDGLKVDSNGNLFASGGGGVLIISPGGKLLGRIQLPDPASNTALSSDEKTLYVTNDMYVLRVVLRE